MEAKIHGKLEYECLRNKRANLSRTFLVNRCTLATNLSWPALKCKHTIHVECINATTIHLWIILISWLHFRGGFIKVHKKYIHICCASVQPIPIHPSLHIVPKPHCAKSTAERGRMQTFLLGKGRTS